MIEVCTIFAPRKQHPQWRDDYLRLIYAQRHSAKRLGHSHTVVTDSDLGGKLNTLRVDLPEELMPAMIMGVIKRLQRPLSGPIVFVDCDCLIDRDCTQVFSTWSFHVGLTYRSHETAPINNGVMYVSDQEVGRALMFYCRALELCKNHWGGDQEAISQAASPVPHKDRNAVRSGAVVRFMSSKYFAAVPKNYLGRHNSFAVHFKGATKEWMIDYAKEYHGYKEEA